jgi:transcriptional regulator with XRE-family HTH domain
MEGEMNMENRRETRILTDQVLDGINYSEDKLALTLEITGNRLATERNKQNLSVAEAALKCGFDASNIYRLERGENVLLKTFLRYVYALNQPVSVFVPFNENVKSPGSIGEQINFLTEKLTIKEKNLVLSTVVSLVDALSNTR